MESGLVLRNRGVPFCCTGGTLARVVNLGDMTKIAAAVRAGEVQAPDVMVGGTPPALC